MAALLRFDSLSSRGFVFWDEGKYALEGLRLLSVIETSLDPHAAALTGKAVGTAKPLHALFIAVAFKVVGVHDYAPLYLDAVASVFAVGVTAWLGFRLFGPTIGVLAAAFLATSGYDIIYARSGLSESDANVLFVAGLLLWWTGWVTTAGTGRRHAMYSLLSGIFLGAAFTANYRLIVYILVLGIVIATATVHARGPRNTLPALLLSAAGVAVCPLIWEAVGIVARLHGVVVFRSEITYLPTTYFQEVLYQVHGGKQSAVHVDPGIYLRWYVGRQGWPASLLLATGIVAAAVRRSLPHLLVLALTLIPYATYSFAPFIVPRNLDASLPFASMLAAVGLVEVCGLLANRLTGRLVVLLCAAATLGAGIWAAALQTDVRSGFATAVVLLDRYHGDGAVINSEVMAFYLRDSGLTCDGPKVPKYRNELFQIIDAGTTLAVLTGRPTYTAKFLIRHAHLLARLPALGIAYHGEDIIASENGAPPSSRLSNWVRVYTVRNLRFLNGGSKTNQHSVRSPKELCSLDRIA